MLEMRDLVRENAALTGELAELRLQLAEFTLATAAELTGEAEILSLAPPGAECASRDAVRLLVVLPRHCASRYDSPVGRRIKIADGEVIIDRRVAERRCRERVCPGRERRGHERRSHHSQVLGAVVCELRSDHSAVQ
jgi:hypothetical protein